MDSLFEMYGANSDLQKNGVWVDFGPCRIKIAYAGDGNPQFEQHMDRAMRPYRRFLDNSDKFPTPDNIKKKIDEAFARVYATSVIKDWENVRRGDEEIAYSVDAATAILMELPPFFTQVRNYAQALENFQDSNFEEDSKNS